MSASTIGLFLTSGSTDLSTVSMHKGFSDIFSDTFIFPFSSKIFDLLRFSNI